MFKSPNLRKRFVIRQVPAKQVSKAAGNVSVGERGSFSGDGDGWLQLKIITKLRRFMNQVS